MKKEKEKQPDCRLRCYSLPAALQHRGNCQIALLAVLFLSALVPRLLMAWKVDVLCNDGALYIHVAQYLEEGDFRKGFKELGFNTFPFILFLISRLGLDPAAGGEMCNVLFASAVVLPLFGWLRRQFDLRVAVVACMLYAVHPALIEWSPELIRDPLFWLMATSSVYLFWRAVHEERLSIFAVAGFVLAAAVFTRVEGLFLIPVLLLWIFRRRQEVPVRFVRQAAGCVLCLTIGPLVLLALNLLLFDGHGRWEWFRTVPVKLAAGWIAPAIEMTSIPVVDRLWLFSHAWESGVTPIYAVLILAGIITRLRIWLRSEHQAVFLFGWAMAFSMWIHLWAAGQSSERYPLFVLILVTPWASLALLDFASWLRRRPLCSQKDLPEAAFATTLVILLIISGIIDALTSCYDSRQARAHLGTWVHQRYGEKATVVGSEDLSKLVAHYSRGKYHCLSEQPTSFELADAVHRRRPTIIMLSTRAIDPESCHQLREAAIRLGFGIEQGPHIAQEENRVIILSRRPAAMLR